MNNFKKFIVLAIAPVLAIVSSVLAFAPSYAANSTDLCSQDLPQEVLDANGCGGSSSTDLSEVIVNIVSGVVGALALVAVIFIVVGGVNYMTSAGDAGKIQKAKSTILYALIGLVISVLAFAIVNFVIRNILK